MEVWQLEWHGMPSVKSSRLAGRSSRGGQAVSGRGKKAGETKSIAASVVAKEKRGPKQASSAPVVARTSYRGAQLVTAFLDAKGHVSVDRVAERFGMSKMQFAETLGLKRESIYRAARLEAPKTLPSLRRRPYHGADSN